MSDRVNKPTSSRPIFVGSDETSVLLLRTLLVSVDSHVREDSDLSGFPVQGGLSQWIIEMYRGLLREINSGESNSSEDKSRVLRAMMETLGFSIDDSAVSRQLIKQAPRLLTVSDAQSMLEARSKGDEMAYLHSFLEVGKKASGILGVKPAETGIDTKTLLTDYARTMRVHKMASRCFAFHQAHPLTLIARARKGDKRAVLDLIKVDKMFLHDSCTEKVIKEAELRSDRSFLRQLARAQQYTPRPRRTTRYRLALYLFFSISTSLRERGGKEIRLPNSAKLHLLLDPEGKDFKTTDALQRFVERCHREWEEFTTEAIRTLSHRLS